MQVVCISANGEVHASSEWRKTVQEGVEAFVETHDADDQQLANTINALGVAGKAACVCTCLCSRLHVYVHVYVQGCMCMYMCMFICLCTYAYMQVCFLRCLSACVYV
jgi:hypothetical protein